MKEIEELKKTVDTLRELGEDWKENMAIINDTTLGYGIMLKSIKHLCKKSNQGNLVRIGLTLIAFPLPIVIDDVLGWSFLAAGLIQRKMKNSTLYLEDVSKTFPHLVKELQEIRQKIV
ncbi:MAG: hypothetical protein ACE5HG_02520 [Candidatus Bathyarchaeia archaeon]